MHDSLELTRRSPVHLLLVHLDGPRVDRDGSERKEEERGEEHGRVEGEREEAGGWVLGVGRVPISARFEGIIPECCLQRG